MGSRFKVQGSKFKVWGARRYLANRVAGAAYHVVASPSGGWLVFSGDCAPFLAGDGVFLAGDGGKLRQLPQIGLREGAHEAQASFLEDARRGAILGDAVGRAAATAERGEGVGEECLHGFGGVALVPVGTVQQVAEAEFAFGRVALRAADADPADDALVSPVDDREVVGFAGALPVVVDDLVEPALRSPLGLGG